MVKHIPIVVIKAFTMIEMLFTLITISFLMLITVYKLPSFTSLESSYLLIGSELMYQQSLSILNNEAKEVIFNQNKVNNKLINGYINGNDIQINGKGNVNLAQSIYIYNQENEYVLKLWLGMGRLNLEKD